MRGGDYGGRFSDNYDGRYGRPSGLIAGRGEAPAKLHHAAGHDLRDASVVSETDREVTFSAK